VAEADQPSEFDQRLVVAQATGVVIGQRGLTPDDALDELATLARERGLSVYELTCEVVENTAS
jgi:AmiR/NasT family two-component response regulator